MSCVSLEAKRGYSKRKPDSNFNSGNDNKLVVVLAKTNYFLCTYYISNIIT